MNRRVSKFVIAAALCAMGGLALAGEEDYSPPTLQDTGCASPIYPKASLQKDEEGVVFLAVHVDAGGNVLDTSVVLSSGSPALEAATQASFRNCRFRPGRVGGQAVAMWKLVEYHWVLKPSNGQLVPKLAKAALDGNAGARYLLGVVLAHRARTDAELQEAMELKINAADLGEPMAQIALGAMYVEGELVGKDMDEARRWYARAAAQGNVYAIDRLRYFGAPH